MRRLEKSAVSKAVLALPDDLVHYQRHRIPTVREMARLAADVNQKTEDIGARRLHTIMEKVLEELSFKAPQIDDSTFTVTAEYVREQLADIIQDEDLSRFIL